MTQPSISPLEPHHLGELIVARALAALAKEGKLAGIVASRTGAPRDAGAARETTLDALLRGVVRYETHVPILPLASTRADRPVLAFDGEHAIEVVALREDGTAKPIEVKLGKTAMAGYTFGRRHLLPPKLTTHEPPRLSTTVAALLDLRRDGRAEWIPGVLANQPLVVRVPRSAAGPAIDARLDEDAVLVVRRSVRASWLASPPPFSNGGPWVVAMDDLVRALGRDEFNDLVRICLMGDQDFAAAWDFDV